MKKWQTHRWPVRRQLAWREGGATALFLSALVFPGQISAAELSLFGDGTFTQEERLAILRLSPLDPTQAADPTNRYDGDPAAIEFGKQLFLDPRLSRGEKHACASCHQPSCSWADGTPKTKLEVTLQRHTPGLWNVAYNRWFNWDGRADSLWAQSLGPIESPLEMANDRTSVVRLLMQDDDLRKAYMNVFGDFPDVLDPEQLPAQAMPGARGSDTPANRAWAELTEQQQNAINLVFVNIGKAIAAFEATILSTDSPFDRFVAALRAPERNQFSGLSESATRGLKLFLGRAKCVVCHAGPTFSDLEFHNVFLPAVDKAHDSDTGRYDGIPVLRQSEFNAQSMYNDAAPGQYTGWVSYVKRTVETRRRFKTPTLRNVERTAPYMHTGQFQTLPEAVEHCGSRDKSMSKDDHSEVILPETELTDKDIEDLVAFLQSLTDESYLRDFTQP